MADGRQQNASNVPGQDLQHNVSNVPGEDPRINTLDVEIKDLKHENEKIKLEKENWKLEKEILTLKLEKTENDSEKIKNELEESKKGIERLQVENKGLQTVAKDNQKPENLQALVTKEDRFIEGISRFIEGVEPKTKEYVSYDEWYNDISERMDLDVVYKYEKLILIRKSGCLKVAGYYSYKYLPLLDPYGYFKSETLTKGWTKGNIRLVCILHPTNPRDFVELDYSRKEKDENGELNYLLWKTNRASKLKECAKAKETEYKGENNIITYSTILCCIKKTSFEQVWNNFEQFSIERLYDR